MKPFNKEEYNRMCAEFLNIKYSELHKGELTTERLESEWMCTYCNLQYTDSHDDFPLLEPMDYLKFHTDWNWIMEVVTKVKPQLWTSKERTLMDCNRNLRYGLIQVDKEAVVQAIWEFLQWYKQQP